MNTTNMRDVFLMARPNEVREVLGQWLRLTRLRQEMTQPMLAAASGVAVTSLSRLEREGQGGIDNLLRVMQALGLLDGFQRELREHVRKASLPKDLADVAKPARTRQRVRRPKSAGGLQ
jgi:transcriptional regulator with XRE-family HTH domain